MPESSHLNLLLKVSQILHSSRGLSETLTDLLKEVMASMGAERGVVVLSRDGKLLPVASHQAPPEVVFEEHPFSTSIIGKVMADGEPIIALDATKDKRVKSPSIVIAGISSILAAPLAWDGEVRGAIYLDNRISAGVFNETHRDLLVVISRQAATTLEAAALFEELQEAHRRSLGNLRNADGIEDKAAPQAIERLLYRMLSSSRELQSDEPSTADVAECRVRLFGELRVMLADKPAPPWKSKKDRELFAYLALQEGRLVHEEHLAELFWPDASKPRHSLQNAVTQIRKILGSKELLQRRHEGYALSKSIWIDLHAFRDASAEAERAVEQGDWDGALRHWGVTDTLSEGQLLEGLQTEWLAPFRQEVEAELMACRAVQADYFAQRGKYLVAIDLWKRVLKLDSCHHEAHLRLMQAYLALGRHADAVRAYQQAEESYRKDLDMEPPENLKELLSEI